MHTIISGLSTEKIDIYTDGSCLKNPGPGAWSFAVIFHDHNYIVASSGFTGDTTNNQMEMMASIKALNFLKQYNMTPKNLNLYTDSQYLKNGITLWIKNWKKNMWKTAARAPVKNKELWQDLDLLNESINPNWQWVKAHEDNFFNNFVDIYANITAKTQNFVAYEKIKKDIEEIDIRNMIGNHKLLII